MKSRPTVVRNLQPLSIGLVLDIESTERKRVKRRETNELLYMDSGWLLRQSKNCRTVAKERAEIK